MNIAGLFHRVDEILASARTGILTTTSSGGKPRSRWMTPTLLNGRRNAIFAVTSPNSRKIKDIEQNRNVQWSIQTPHLSEIITLNGQVNIVSSPSFNSEIIESVGNKLTVYWKINPDRTDFVVLETIVESAEYFMPMKEIRERYLVKED